MVTASTLTLMTETSLCVGSPWCRRSKRHQPPTKGGRAPRLRTFRPGSIIELWRMRHFRSSMASSRQALGKAARCTLTSPVCRWKKCPTRPASAEICPSKSCSKRPLSSTTPTSLKQPLMACCAERKCRGVRLSTFVTPRRTRSCTPGPLTRRHLALQNLWTTLAPRKCWPSPKALLQARIWLSSLSNHARGLLPTWSSRAPSARTTAASASSTAASAPSLCAI